MKRFFSFLLPIVTSLLLICSCKRSPDEAWNDTKSASRHVSRGMQTLGGKHGDERQTRTSAEFATQKGDMEFSDDYVAFGDEQRLRMSEGAAMQPKETPGELGSAIPGISAFKEPTGQLARIFEKIHFEYNSSLIKGETNLRFVHEIADWMRKHQNTYLFIEGHCDQRGPAAYNLALGANRANAVRNFLLKEGISSDRLFTVSYGKERPLLEGNSEDVWKINRRAQFKLYEK